MILEGNDSRGSKRQLSPNDKESENEDVGEDFSGWAVATGARSRRNQKGSNRSTVTPIVIRRKSCQDEIQGLNQIAFDIDDEQMDQDITESGYQEETYVPH